MFCFLILRDWNSAVLLILAGLLALVIVPVGAKQSDISFNLVPNYWLPIFDVGKLKYVVNCATAC